MQCDRLFPAFDSARRRRCRRCASTASTALLVHTRVVPLRSLEAYVLYNRGRRTVQRTSCFCESLICLHHFFLLLFPSPPPQLAVLGYMVGLITASFVIRATGLALLSFFGISKWSMPPSPCMTAPNPKRRGLITDRFSHEKVPKDVDYIVIGKVSSCTLHPAPASASASAAPVLVPMPCYCCGFQHHLQSLLSKQTQTTAP